MPVYEEGPAVDTLTGKNVRAKDHNGDFVSVSASHEAIRDHGWTTIWNTASRMYDAGDFEIVKGTPVIRVTTSKCEGA